MRVLLVLALAVATLLLLRPWRGDDAAIAGGDSALAAGATRPPDPAPGPATAARAAPEVLTDHKVPRPLHVPGGGRPGSRRLVGELPEVERGIPLPDGRMLPFLNGMTWAPPLSRDAIHGPLPPVVAIVVDAEGFEWYEHADGSMTTTMYQQVVLPDESYWDPTTKHTVPKRAAMIRSVDDR